MGLMIEHMQKLDSNQKETEYMAILKYPKMVPVLDSGCNYYIHYHGPTLLFHSHMMVQSSLVLVAALLINTLSCYSQEDVYCVTPTATSCSSCPQNSTHCTTLAEYAQEAELYFTSNTTMVFLPGDHVLDANITVANVARLTMHGESSSGTRATIVCNGAVGLSFTSMVAFKINSLAFASCNRKDGTAPLGNYALLLKSAQYAELGNCSFHDNIATALVVINTSITLAENSEFIHNHCESDHSCAVSALNSNLTFTGNTTFLDNSATSSTDFAYGGAIYASYTVLSFNGISNFINNSAHYGGAIYILGNTVLGFNGSSNFINNKVAGEGAGGAIYILRNTVLNFNGTSNFINNSAYYYGGAIFTSNNTALSFNGTSNFINNQVAGEDADGGAIFTSNNTALSFNGTSNFINNSACYGGVIHTSGYAVLSFNGTSNFVNNSACYGGVIHTWVRSITPLVVNTVLSFNGNSNFINNQVAGEDAGGGAIYTLGKAALSFNGNSNFINNSAIIGGAIFTSHNTVLSFNGTNNFINNSAHAGGAISIRTTLLSFNGTSNFINNSAHYGGAIFTNINSTMTFSESISFTNNGYYGGGGDTQKGGGVYMGLKCTFSILPHTTVHWENNHATLGGAIYAYDTSPISYCTPLTPYVPKQECFFQLPGQNLSNGIDVQLVFKNNSAGAAGSVLYGGVIDHCKLTHGLDSHSSGKVFDMIVHSNDTDYSTSSNISSDPFHICPCENHLPDYSKSLYHFPYSVYPGEIFQVSVAAAGQRNGTVPSKVISTIIEKDPYTIHLHSHYQLQQANNTCTTFSYAVFSLSQYVRIELHTESSPCDGQLQIVVNLNQTCPSGSCISTSEKACVCEPRIAQYTHQCTITNRVTQITRDSEKHFWLGYDNQSDELILHPLCPFDYCVSYTVVFPLNNTDLQCAYNKSGLLCGACKEGYSRILGTSRCKQCTNSHLVLLVPFAVMGIALVFFLLVCKLTVATGALSGLVLYANIIGANRTIFLPMKSTDAFSVFIAWLNLDFGIETCFYNGMDAYSKTWLQFVFPAYIWMLVGLIILISNLSQRFANMLGNNPVSVLATLILLSYTKILHTLITVFYITYLEYPTYNRRVWLYDANIDYLSGKHIPLLLVAVLVFLFLFLPYTLLLLFGQWLQAISHLRFFSWVNSARLKPFMDSYHAPYKAKHRYWPGLLLVLRFVLLLVFAFNIQEEVSVNLLAILVGIGLLYFWAWVSGGVYRNWCLDALEGSFALNLTILSAATYHVKLTRGNQLAVVYTSVSIAFATFIGILVYQLTVATGIIQYTKRKCAALKVAIKNLFLVEKEVMSPTSSLPDRLVNPWDYEPPYNTLQGHTIAEPTEGVTDAQTRPILTYTYGSFN